MLLNREVLRGDAWGTLLPASLEGPVAVGASVEGLGLKSVKRLQVVGVQLRGGHLGPPNRQLCHLLGRLWHLPVMQQRTQSIRQHRYLQLGSSACTQEAQAASCSCSKRPSLTRWTTLTVRCGRLALPPARGGCPASEAGTASQHAVPLPSQCGDSATSLGRHQCTTC